MQTVLITGASRGIGRACAFAFAQSGYRVAVHYNRSAHAADEVVRALHARGCDALALQADVSDPASVARMADRAAAFGGVDVLVNNAGVALQKMARDTSREEWDALFAVNMRGAWCCANAVTPHMLRRQGGRIVNISSIWGLCGASCEVAYSASKAALIGFTKALAKELAPGGITVNCVAPGVIDTDMCAELDAPTRAQLAAETPLGRLGLPEDVAGAVVFLASPAAAFITGQTLTVDGGLCL